MSLEAAGEFQTRNNQFLSAFGVSEEKTERKENMRQLYDTTKKVVGKYGKPERLAKNKESKPLTETQQQRNRWVEHSEGPLNGQAPLNPPDIGPAPSDLPITVTPPMTEEIIMVIRQIKGEKAAAPDNIPTEAPKSHIEITANTLDVLL